MLPTASHGRMPSVMCPGGEDRGVEMCDWARCVRNQPATAAANPTGQRQEEASFLCRCRAGNVITVGDL
jgi:hypothetical protein